MPFGIGSVTVIEQRWNRVLRLNLIRIEMEKNLFDKPLFFLPFEAGILNERFNFVVILRFCTTEYRIIKSDLYHERVQYLEICIYNWKIL